MSMFTFIPKAVTQKAVESVLEGVVMGRAVGSAAMSVAKSTFMNRQKYRCLLKDVMCAMILRRRGAKREAFEKYVIRKA